MNAFSHHWHRQVTETAIGQTLLMHHDTDNEPQTISVPPLQFHSRCALYVMFLNSQSLVSTPNSTLSAVWPWTAALNRNNGTDLTEL